jgi:serine protease Do
MMMINNLAYPSPNPSPNPSRKGRGVFLFLAGLIMLISAKSAYAETLAMPQSREQVTLTFAPLVKQVVPAVVNIYTMRMVQQRISPLFEDPFFRQFFGNALPPGFSRQRLEGALGSGVIVRADGLIVTSNHVIAGADQIRVVLSDRREFDATVVAKDDHTDLAVLRIDSHNEKLPTLALKDSDEAQVGDLVLAVGNPFGVGQTVTMGIISAITHKAVGSSDIDYFIQTDAAINPGNSGGALVTTDGKLAGINAAIYSHDGGNLGIGFAVPSNIVRVMIDAVAQGRKSIVHPWLGIEGQDVTPEIAASLNMAQPSGMLVNQLSPASPAAKAGLRVGDVIMSVNGHVIEDTEAFRYRIATQSVGSTAELGILRKSEKLTLSVPLIAPPEDMPRDETMVTGHSPLQGAVIANLSPAVIEETGLRGLSRGVVIKDVKENSAADGVGLQPGDVILSINGAKTGSVKEVLDALHQQTRRWRLSIQRGEGTITLMVGG